MNIHLRYLLLLVMAMITACSDNRPPSEREFAGQKVLYINSYHVGYTWSDRIEAEVKRIISNTKAEFKIFHMNAKGQNNESKKIQAGLAAKAAIENFKPDIVIVSDDKAVKYLLQPYYKDSTLPFVFCGINWDAATYELPYSNATGMVEVEPIQSLVNELSRYARGERLGYIGLDSLTEHKTVHHSQLHLGREFNQIYLVADFASWQQAFLAAQTEVDMLIMGVHVSIENWDEQQAQEFVLQQARIPSGTPYHWVINYALIGIVKIPEEHGRWAAQTALKVLDGANIANIPIVSSREYNILLNHDLAKRMKLQFSPKLLHLEQQQ
jgi:hypothetical protein